SKQVENNVDEEEPTSTTARRRISSSTHGCNSNSRSRRCITPPNISQLQLTHVEIVFLLSNNTSHLQTLDARIIESFKNYFK
ncbi:5729_t:CDS:2, partial [Funneliformis geosporum]